MKMGFIFSGVFWGIILLLIGGSVILRATTGIRIPVFRIVVGLILIYWGARVLLGGGCSGKNEAIFGEKKIKADSPAKKYTTVFGTSRVDLGGMKLKAESVDVDSDTVFGSTTIVIPKGVAVLIKVDAVFASAILPDDSSVNFGNKTYRSGKYDKDKPALLIDADVVFGQLVIKEE